MRVTRAGEAALLVSVVLLFGTAVFRDIVMVAVSSILLVVIAAEAAWVALVARRPGARLALEWKGYSGRAVLYPSDESVELATLTKSVGGTLELLSRAGFQRMKPTAFKGSGRKQVEFRFQTDYAGDYAWDDVQARIAGPLGLFTAVVSIRHPQRYLVYPRIMQVAASTVRLIGRTEVGEAPMDIPGVGSEFYELRDYHPGDDYRNVNWKASARLGDLVVLERMKEVGSSFLLVLDARAPGFRETDALASAFLMLANSLGSSGVSFGVLVHDGRRVIDASPIQDPRTSLSVALKAALGVARIESGPELLELVPLGKTSRFAPKSLGAEHPLSLLSELRGSELGALTRESDPWAAALKFVRDTQVRTVIYVSGVFEDLQGLIELAWEARHYRDAEFMVANPCEADMAESRSVTNKTARAMAAAGIPYHRGSPMRISEMVLSATASP